MSMWTLSIALLTALVVWFVLVRRLTAKPWVHAGDAGYSADIQPINRPAKKVALFFLLAAITSLFALFITAYVMRMDPHHGGDWHSIVTPGVLWINTILLVLASIAMQWAKSLAVTADKITTNLRLGLLAGGILTLAFLVGQYVAWQQLHASVYFQISNPALAFFYLLTGIHGLHLLGGLYVWARATVRARRESDTENIRLSIELCTVYWHYLLLVWLVLFGLLLTT